MAVRRTKQEIFGMIFGSGDSDESDAGLSDLEVGVPAIFHARAHAMP